MGIYINIGNAAFQRVRNSEYVDKSGLIAVKKYKTELALNNFIEYSMVEPRRMGRFFGFTKDEVRALAAKHGMDFDELEKWYDGYQIGNEQSISFYYARNNYVIHRELPTGKGFADLVLIPRKNVNSPAIVFELKFNKTVDAAIDQIKRRQYPAKLADYADRLLLVAINYDRESKAHSCSIEAAKGA
ncbi:MAG: PD-(D/E)XK nuclease domain-containing protein [Prevotella sp.]|nr:PD-(D/E)XK nuclease domain-containing protein [Prevotella sp.]